MHGYSTLDADKPRDPAKLIATSTQMADVLRAKNPKVELYLMATWSRADETYPAKGAWAGQPIEAMAHDVRAATTRPPPRRGVKAVIPVGEALDARDPDRRGRSESVRRHRGGEAGSLDLRQLPRQHVRLLPRGARDLRQRHRPRSALARPERVLGVRAGAVARQRRRRCSRSRSISSRARAPSWRLRRQPLRPAHPNAASRHASLASGERS